DDSLVDDIWTLRIFEASPHNDGSALRDVSAFGPQGPWNLEFDASLVALESGETVAVDAELPLQKECEVAKYRELGGKIRRRRAELGLDPLTIWGPGRA